MLKFILLSNKKLSKKGCENFSHYIFIQKVTSLFKESLKSLNTEEPSPCVQ